MSAEFTTIINSRIGETKGHLRIWLEGGKLARCGYKPDDKYSIDILSEKVVLTRSNSGLYAVSRRNKSGRVLPLIEITSARCEGILRMFSNEQMIRVVVDQHKIIISKHHVDAQTEDRETRLITKLSTNQTLDTCSLFYGFGMLDRAAHDGLNAAGIHSRLSVIVEREAKYIDPAIETNPDMFSGSTYIIESPVQFARITEKNPVDILIAGIPCTGASKSGKAKNKNKTAEDHPDAGAMFYYTLRCIELMNPAIICLENVCEYSNTESMAVIRSVLTSMGYELIETVLSGKDYGSIEDRKRMCLFAISINLNVSQFTFTELLRYLSALSVSSKETKLSDILDNVPLDSEMWKDYDYLAAKEVKDIEAGKGFRRQLLTGTESQCGTIGRHYNKGRSTEPFIKHPLFPDKSRLLTVAEHAKVKGYPLERMNNTMSVTTAHEALGQGIIYPAFKAAFEVLGEFLTSLIKIKHTPM